MGTRFPSRTTRGRLRHDAGAASFRFGPASPAAEASAGPPAPWTLRTTDTLRPGDRGTKALVSQFGDRLVCVRYRCDPVRCKRYKTVELVVAEAEWAPPPGPDDLVHVRVAFAEEDLRQRVKAAGGRWWPASKTWEPRRAAADELGLRDRIVALPDSQMYEPSEFPDVRT